MDAFCCMFRTWWDLAPNIFWFKLLTLMLFCECLLYMSSRLWGLEELWILFGSGKNRRYIAAYKIAIQLRRERCMGLRGFHAFTGCDSVSLFAGKGKKDGKHGCHVSQQQMHLLLCLFRMTTFQFIFKHFLKTLHQRCMLQLQESPKVISFESTCSALKISRYT